MHRGGVAVSLDRSVTKNSTAAACRVFHLHGVVDAELIHDRCPVMTAHALVEVQSTCHAAGMVVVLVRGRCNDHYRARRKSLADDDRVPPVTQRMSPAGVTHDMSGGSALVIWSEMSSISSCPGLWRAAGRVNE